MGEGTAVAGGSFGSPHNRMCHAGLLAHRSKVACKLLLYSGTLTHGVCAARPIVVALLLLLLVSAAVQPRSFRTSSKSWASMREREQLGGAGVPTQPEQLGGGGAGLLNMSSCEGVSAHSA